MIFFIILDALALAAGIWLVVLNLDEPALLEIWPGFRVTLETWLLLVVPAVATLVLATLFFQRRARARFAQNQALQHRQRILEDELAVFRNLSLIRKEGRSGRK